MTIYDISQEVFTCEVYPGDISPEIEPVMRMSQGSLYNLSNFRMCAHNGTHIDAPFHFIENGKKINEISLEKVIGQAIVISYSGIISAAGALTILENSRVSGTEVMKRILIKGNAVVSLEAAEVFAAAGIDLLAVESQSVGPEDAPMAVHQVLLAAEVVLLEGIRLENVPDGIYLLNAAPISLGGSDGAPCRAVLIKH